MSSTAAVADRRLRRGRFSADRSEANREAIRMLVAPQTTIWQ